MYPPCGPAFILCRSVRRDRSTLWPCFHSVGVINTNRLKWIGGSCSIHVISSRPFNSVSLNVSYFANSSFTPSESDSSSEGEGDSASLINGTNFLIRIRQISKQTICVIRLRSLSPNTNPMVTVGSFTEVKVSPLRTNQLPEIFANSVILSIHQYHNNVWDDKVYYQNAKTINCSYYLLPFRIRLVWTNPKTVYFSVCHSNRI